MDLVAIERDSFDAFKKHLKHIIDLTEGLSSPNLIPIEQEWIEGKELAASLNISLRTPNTSGEWKTFVFYHRKENLLSNSRSKIFTGTKQNQI